MSSPACISEIRYGWETTFATKSTTITKTFGQGIKITSLTRRNNIEPVFGLGARNAAALPVKQFEGSLSVEFIMANPWWIRAVLGATPTTTGSANDYTHTFVEGNTPPGITIENEVTSDTPSVAALVGAKVSTCTISAAVNELARVKLDMNYVDEEVDATADTHVPETFVPFSMAEASLEFPNASTISDIQNVEVVINNTPEPVYGLGSRVATQIPVKNRIYTARISRPFEDSATFLEAFYGASTGPNATVAETATMELNFSNGLSTTSERSITFLFTGVKIDEHNMPQDPTALIMEDLPLTMRACTTVIANNSTSVSP